VSATNGHGHDASEPDDDRYASNGFLVNSGSDLFKRPKIK
jgi:hypothetical protein